MNMIGAQKPMFASTLLHSVGTGGSATAVAIVVPTSEPAQPEKLKFGHRSPARVGRRASRKYAPDPGNRPGV